MGARNAFGQVNDIRCPYRYPTLSTLAFKNKGGKFVIIDTNGKISLATATSLYVIGWAEVGEFTCVAGDLITVNIAKDAVYEMPIDAAKTEAELTALLMSTCDIIVTGGIQYADLDAASYAQLQIVGYAYYGSALGEQTVYVRRNDAVYTVFTAV